MIDANALLQLLEEAIRQGFFSRDFMLELAKSIKEQIEVYWPNSAIPVLMAKSPTKKIFRDLVFLDALDSKSSPWKQGCGFDSLLRHALFPIYF